MLKKMGYLLWASALYCTNSFAITHNLLPGFGIQYELLPKTPEVFSNIYYQEITVHCAVSSKDHHNQVLVEVMSKSGKIKGITFSAGDAPQTLTISSGEELVVTADAGAKVKFTNQGKNPIIFNCSLPF